MKALVLLLGTTILLVSCHMFKSKISSATSKQSTYALSLASQKQQMITEEEQDSYKEANELKVEWLADDSFFWHPDSGIVSKYGPLRLKIQSTVSSEKMNVQLQAEQLNFIQDTLLKHTQMLNKQLNTVQSKKKQTVLLNGRMIVVILSVLVVLLLGYRRFRFL